MLRSWVARPTVISAEVAAIIEAQRAPGLSVSKLHKRVAAAGVRIARGTLDSYLRKGLKAPPRPRAELPDHMAVQRSADAALAAGDDLAALRQAQADVAEHLRIWAPRLSDSGTAVRAYAALIAVLHKVTASIVELTPVPEADRYRPVEGSAMAELLERAEASARDETAAAATVRRYERLIADGLLVTAEAEA
jgi:hypothetical protein